MARIKIDDLSVNDEMGRDEQKGIFGGLSIELENTLISSYSVSGTGGDAAERPMESLALNFTKVEYQYRP